MVKRVKLTPKILNKDIYLGSVVTFWFIL